MLSEVLGVISQKVGMEDGVKKLHNLQVYTFQKINLSFERSPSFSFLTFISGKGFINLQPF